MRLALFDYGVGNIHSLAKGLEHAGAEVLVVREAGPALEADALVLPGVGAFGAAAAALAPAADTLREAIADGLPCLGICLGMQLLFDTSDEGTGRGMGVIPGRVRRLRATRVPHMGWNAVDAATADPVLAGLDGLVAYYANSFAVAPEAEDAVIAWTTYEADTFPAAVRSGRTWGVQFHPEKSGAPGLRLIRNFLAEAAR